MPLNSKGCKAKINKVFNCNPNYQLVQLYTYKKNPPTAKKEFSIDFIETCALRNNRTQVKEGDVIIINAFTVSGGFYDKIKGRTIYININDWELKDAYNYSKLKDIEYKGGDYEDDE